MNNYDQSWYDRYREHLEEEVIRNNHDKMFDFLFTIMRPSEECDYGCANVIDLGCGTQEFYKYGYPTNYFGIDKNYVEKEYDCYSNIKDHIGMIGDYTKLNLTEVCPFTPNTFVSLFSTELFMWPEDKYDFYDRIFLENPSIHFGIVAGVIYKGCEHKYAYVEPDGFNIFQTIENQYDYQSEIFEEFRTYIPSPSKLFGENVIEVFKFFRKK